MMIKKKRVVLGIALLINVGLTYELIAGDLMPVGRILAPNPPSIFSVPKNYKPRIINISLKNDILTMLLTDRRRYSYLLRNGDIGLVSDQKAGDIPFNKLHALHKEKFPYIKFPFVPYYVSDSLVNEEACDDSYVVRVDRPKSTGELGTESSTELCMLDLKNGEYWDTAKGADRTSVTVMRKLAAASNVLNQ